MRQLLLVRGYKWNEGITFLLIFVAQVIVMLSMYQKSQKHWQSIC